MSVAEFKGAAGVKVPTEHQECAWLFEWAQMTRWRDLKVSDVLIHIPNGAFHGRDRAVGAVIGGKLRKQGMQAGVFDYIVPVPTIQGGYITTGLWLEMKRTRKGTVSDEQKAFHARMLRFGWRCEVAKGWIAASKVIEAYLQSVTTR